MSSAIRTPKNGTRATRMGPCANTTICHPAITPNVNVEPPFDRHVGGQPALSGEEMDDIHRISADLERWLPRAEDEAASLKTARTL